jgi:hypothetical protein
MQNTALSRWVRENNAPAERVIEIARHYGANFYEALMAAGYLTQEDLTTARVMVDLSGTPSFTLLEELMRRAMLSDDMKRTVDTQTVTRMVRRIVGEKPESKAND